jgi:hypothetical protein
MQCDVILTIFAYQTNFKLNILGKKEAASILPKRGYIDF